MDHATLRALMAFGIYLFLLRIGLQSEDQAAALTNAPERTGNAVSHADALMKSLGLGPQQ